LLRWYAIVSKIRTKDRFLKEIKKSSSSSKLRRIKNVVIHDFDTENLDARDDYGTGLEGSLLDGYVLIQFDDKDLKDIVKGIESRKIGKFLRALPKEPPPPIPQNEVVRFQSGVKKKKDKIVIGDMVKVTDGILKGFEGVVVRKNKLMVMVEVELPNSTVRRKVNLVSLEKKR
jgi:transcription antitermination factor NusG